MSNNADSGISSNTRKERHPVEEQTGKAVNIQDQDISWNSKVRLFG